MDSEVNMKELYDKMLKSYWEKKFKEEEKKMDTDEENEFIESFFAPD